MTVRRVLVHLLVVAAVLLVGPAAAAQQVTVTVIVPAPVPESLPLTGIDLWPRLWMGFAVTVSGLLLIWGGRWLERRGADET